MSKRRKWHSSGGFVFFLCCASCFRVAPQVDWNPTSHKVLSKIEIDFFGHQCKIFRYRHPLPASTCFSLHGRYTSYSQSRRCLHPSRLTNASTTAGENAYRRREFVPTQSRSCALGSVATAVIGCACLAATMSSNAKAVVAEKSSLGGTEHRENVAAVSLEEDENEALVAAAHELRRSLVPPHQSLFRVVCILVYEDIAGKFHRITGEYAFRTLCAR